MQYLKDSRNLARWAVAVLLLVAIAGVALAERDEKEKEHRKSQYKAIPPAVERQVSFLKDVEPIFSDNCQECHNAKKHKGGFRIDTRDAFLKGGEDGPPIVVGNSAKSKLVKMIAWVGVDSEEMMPPKSDQLKAEEIGIIRAWIDQGAKWETAEADKKK